jgi:hypothetical protein
MHILNNTTTFEFHGLSLVYVHMNNITNELVVSQHRGMCIELEKHLFRKLGEFKTIAQLIWEFLFLAVVLLHVFEKHYCCSHRLS